ncbi:hypothetical protein OG884_25595 [Streptosporangium sp. NBC_01755]|nr:MULTISPECIES: hypothetical protein [unclassified Streptosporangium]WSA23555.1 hypothetical protein OIE13_21625 [Streptosporangium sp. NBC_01810]WSC98235.1 hypothetical protein OG884_25595 [Streptosporangium sp. NBC_01755]
MDKTVIMTVDDDPGVSRSIARDLRVESKPGDTRFQVRLPVTEASAPT